MAGTGHKSDPAKDFLDARNRRATGGSKPHGPDLGPRPSGFTALVAAAALAAACGAPPDLVVDPLSDLDVLRPVRSWAAQLQGLEAGTAQRRLLEARVDLLVLEPMRSQRGLSEFPTAELVARLHRSPGETLPGKRVLAYLNVGQAEEYRSYWQPDWQAPAAGRPGRPDFLLTVDPDGWPGNYPVAFWDPRWKALLFGSPDALLDQVLADGFDGAYLDWVMAAHDPHVVAAARRAGIDPVAEMVELLAEMRAYARARRPLFVLLAQNAVQLAEDAPQVCELLDGIAQEDLSFRGEAGAAWDDPRAGDIPAPESGPWSTAVLATRLQRLRAKGLPVFTLDYALDPANVRLAAERSRSHGFVPFVSRVGLQRL